jgi:hypothetical protein
VLNASNFFLPVMLLCVFRGEGEGEDAIQLALTCEESPLLVVPPPSAAAWSIEQSHVALEGPKMKYASTVLEAGQWCGWCILAPAATKVADV